MKHQPSSGREDSETLSDKDDIPKVSVVQSCQVFMGCLSIEVNGKTVRCPDGEERCVRVEGEGVCVRMEKRDV